MIGGASKGMQTILDAAVKNKVKKIVVTSSFATICGGVWKKSKGDPNYSEEDVAPMEGSDSYAKSKIA
jgi:nucleoside-diphosphate-sugar epimerase